MSKSDVDYANEIILTLTRDELEVIRESLRQFSMHNERHGYAGRARASDELRNKIVNIILDSVRHKLDKPAVSVLN
jgi:hypothetical protein